MYHCRRTWLQPISGKRLPAYRSQSLQERQIFIHRTQLCWKCQSAVHSRERKSRANSMCPSIINIQPTRIRIINNTIEMGSSQTILIPTQTHLKFTHQFINNPTLLVLQDQKYLQVSHPVEQPEYQKWQVSLNRYKEQDTHCVLLPLKTKFTISGVCSSMGNAEIVYDNFCTLMSQEISQRSRRDLPFQESQIWIFLLYLVKAQGEARSAGDILGDIRPNNVFKTEQGKIKIASLSSWPEATTAFQRGMQKLPAFVSPEDMTNLAKGSLQSPDAQASMMFSIGLTLLSLANMFDYEILYKMQDWNFSLEQLGQAVLRLKCNRLYSQILRCTICNLCSTQHCRRVEMEQIRRMILKQQGKITRKEHFVVECPEKLRLEVEMLHNLILEHPCLFASPSLLSQAGGSGIVFPEHLRVEKVRPEYFVDLSPTIIKQLQESL